MCLDFFFKKRRTKDDYKVLKKKYKELVRADARTQKELAKLFDKLKTRKLVARKKDLEIKVLRMEREQQNQQMELLHLVNVREKKEVDKLNTRIEKEKTTNNRLLEIVRQAEIECIVCLEEIKSDEFVLSKCLHVYCMDCYSKLTSCAFCRRDL